MKHFAIITSFYFSFFTVIAQVPYTAYHGNLHSHTSISDGVGSPEDAFNHARDSAHLDFLAVTDHLEQIYLDLLGWYETNNAADAATVNNVFVGFAGYEWGSPQYGHCNVLNAENMGDPTTYTDLSDFYQDVLDASPAFGFFNHPAEEVYFTNWDNFAYAGAVVDAAFPLIEMQELYQEYWYFFALNHGWHLSPVMNQDNHSADWGTKNDKRAGIWATDLSRQSLIDAMIAGRTFASWDKNAEMWIDISGQPMGQTLQRYADMPLHIYITDPDTESWSSVDIVDSTGTISTFIPSGSTVDTIINITPSVSDWIVVRACQADSQVVWSAPIYFTGIITQLPNQYLESFFNTFPNPSDGLSTFESSDDIERIEITDITGNIVFCNNFKNTRKISVNLDELSKGIYLAKIFSENNITTKKLMIY